MPDLSIQTARWLVVTVLDCIIELFLVLTPAYFLADLQMNLTNKITAGIAFAIRLGVVPFSALHLSAYRTALDTNSAGTSVSTVVCWQQATLCYSLLSATVPLGRTFLKRFQTGNLTLNPSGTYSTAHRTLDSSTRSADRLDTDTSVTGKKGSNRRFWMAAPNTHSTSIYHEEAQRSRIGSQDMIIRRDDVVEVERS